jgi:hypothetical protein
LRITIELVPTVRVVDETPVAPGRVLAAARDFSERRAEMWPDVHVEHLEVHEAGETFAEVTEGNPWPIGYVWERLRYDWSEPGSVKGVVTDSNILQAREHLGDQGHASEWWQPGTGNRSSPPPGLQGQATGPRVPPRARQADGGRPFAPLPLQGRGARIRVSMR